MPRCRSVLEKNKESSASKSASVKDDVSKGGLYGFGMMRVGERVWRKTVEVLLYCTNWRCRSNVEVVCRTLVLASRQSLLKMEHSPLSRARGSVYIDRGSCEPRAWYHACFVIRAWLRYPTSACCCFRCSLPPQRQHLPARKSVDPRRQGAEAAGGDACMGCVARQSGYIAAA